MIKVLIAIVATTVFLAGSAHAQSKTDAPTLALVGHYHFEVPWSAKFMRDVPVGRPKWVFIGDVDVYAKGQKEFVSVTIEGSMSEGILTFGSELIGKESNMATFNIEDDGFGNKGQGSMEKGKDGYVLRLISLQRKPATGNWALGLYGDYILNKISDKPNIPVPATVNPKQKHHHKPQPGE